MTEWQWELAATAACVAASAALEDGVPWETVRDASRRMRMACLTGSANQLSAYRAMSLWHTGAWAGRQSR